MLDFLPLPTAGTFLHPLHLYCQPHPTQIVKPNIQESSWGSLLFLTLHLQPITGFCCTATTSADQDTLIPRDLQHLLVGLSAFDSLQSTRSRAAGRFLKTLDLSLLSG